MFQINMKGAEPQWYGWPEDASKEKQAKLKIRPYPSSRSETIVRRTPDNEKNIEVVFRAKDRKEIYMFCLMEIKDLTDENGHPLKLTDTVRIPADSGFQKMPVKEFIFEYQQHTGLPAYIIEKGNVVVEEIEEEEKN